jgi:hypothetical protein
MHNSQKTCYGVGLRTLSVEQVLGTSPHLQELLSVVQAIVPQVIDVSICRRTHDRSVYEDVPRILASWKVRRTGTLDIVSLGRRLPSCNPLPRQRTDYGKIIEIDEALKRNPFGSADIQANNIAVD